MIHTHTAIGDITPGNWIVKIVVNLHVTTTYLMTLVSVIDDLDILVENRSETRSRNSRAVMSEHSPLLGLS